MPRSLVAVLRVVGASGLTLDSFEFVEFFEICVKLVWIDNIHDSTWVRFRQYRRFGNCMNLKMFFDCINVFQIYDFILNFLAYSLFDFRFHFYLFFCGRSFLSIFVSDLHIWTSGDFYFSSCVAPFLRCLFLFCFLFLLFYFDIKIYRIFRVRFTIHFTFLNIFSVSFAKKQVPQRQTMCMAMAHNSCRAVMALPAYPHWSWCNGPTRLLTRPFFCVAMAHNLIVR